MYISYNGLPCYTSFWKCKQKLIIMNFTIRYKVVITNFRIWFFSFWSERRNVDSWINRKRISGHWVSVCQSIFVNRSLKLKFTVNIKKTVLKLILKLVVTILNQRKCSYFVIQQYIQIYYLIFIWISYN